jgi:hypothetical protein
MRRSHPSRLIPAVAAVVASLRRVLLHKAKRRKKQKETSRRW